MNERKYKVELKFIRDILGSSPADEELKNKYIKTKMMTGKSGVSAEIAQGRLKEEKENLQKDEKYQEKIEDIQESSVTVFYRDKNGNLALGDHQIRGFIKEAFAFVGKKEKWLKKGSGEIYSGKDSYRNWIGDRIRFTERFYPYKINGNPMTLYDRPLRCQTMQGPRVAIAASECLPAGTTVTFEIEIEDDVTEAMLMKILDRGKWRGISQWGNAQYGTFEWRIIK